MALAGSPLVHLLLRPATSSASSSSSCRFLSVSTRTLLALPRPVSCCSLSVAAQEAEPKLLAPAFAPPQPPAVLELSVKEKKELASYAHSLGKKLKSQQVGKSGVTPNVAASFVETLEANELLKLKVHNSCPGELPDVVRQLEELTGSVVVGQIGRSVILYRPSLSKMKEAVKKKQHIQRMRKGFVLKASESEGRVPRLYGRGRRAGVPVVLTHPVLIEW